MNKTVSPLYYTPGCALMLYKPILAQKVHRYLKTIYPDIAWNEICCRHAKALPEGAAVISICSGCIHYYLQQGYRSVSLWEVIDRDGAFEYPNHQGRTVSLQDACPTRHVPIVHDSIRSLLAKMNLLLIETERRREHTACCGDIYWEDMNADGAIQKMKERGAQMPTHDIVVHCVSCIKAFANAQKSPLYLVDLLFREPTTAYEPIEPTQWHTELATYIENHGIPRTNR